MTKEQENLVKRIAINDFALWVYANMGGQYKLETLDAINTFRKMLEERANE